MKITDRELFEIISFFSLFYLVVISNILIYYERGFYDNVYKKVFTKAILTIQKMKKSKKDQ